MPDKETEPAKKRDQRARMNRKRCFYFGTFIDDVPMKYKRNCSINDGNCSGCPMAEQDNEENQGEKEEPSHE